MSYQQAFASSDSKYNEMMLYSIIHRLVCREECSKGAT